MGKVEETVFEPVIARAWEKWLSQFSWRWLGFWVGVLSLLGVVYWKLNVNEWRFVVVSLMSGVIMMGARLPWLVGNMISKKLEVRSEKVVVWVLWIVGVIMAKRVGWVAENIDNGTALFLLYLPAVWLFKIPRAVNGFLALAIIPFLPFFLAFGMERTAEIWAVALYFLLVTATVQMVKEVRDEKDS